jgi:NAD(P)-dependent dehydrogenase (short-subunit alcohol dehydrogenase family)
LAGAPQTVLLTGASTGLGLAISRLLLPLQQYRLILTARDASLPRFAAADIEENDRVRLRPLDVTDDGERGAIVSEALADWGGVDVLINNAGIAYRAVVEHVTDAERMEQMGINFRGPMALVRLVLPQMRAKGAGRIINVSSVGGMMAMPTMPLYSASKFALEGATEALYYEVRPFGIHATLIEPGFINSSSFQNTHYTSQAQQSEADPQDPYHCHYRNMGPFIERKMGLSMATPEKVARRILHTMQRNKPPLRVAATPDAVLFDLLRRFLPRRLYHAILYRSLPGIKTWGPDRQPQ